MSASCMLRSGILDFTSLCHREWRARSMSDTATVDRPASKHPNEHPVRDLTSSLIRLTFRTCMCCIGRNHITYFLYCELKTTVRKIHQHHRHHHRRYHRHHYRRRRHRCHRRCRHHPHGHYHQNRHYFRRYRCHLNVSTVFHSRKRRRFCCGSTFEWTERSRDPKWCSSSSWSGWSGWSNIRINWIIRIKWIIRINWIIRLIKQMNQYDLLCQSTCYFF